MIQPLQAFFFLLPHLRPAEKQSRFRPWLSYIVPFISNTHACIYIYSITIMCIYIYIEIYNNNNNNRYIHMYIYIHPPISNIILFPFFQWSHIWTPELPWSLPACLCPGTGSRSPTTPTHPESPKAKKRPQQDGPKRRHPSSLFFHGENHGGFPASYGDLMWLMIN